MVRDSLFRVFSHSPLYASRRFSRSRLLEANVVVVSSYVGYARCIAWKKLLVYCVRSRVEERAVSYERVVRCPAQNRRLDGLLSCTCTHSCVAVSHPLSSRAWSSLVFTRHKTSFTDFGSFSLFFHESTLLVCTCSGDAFLSFVLFNCSSLRVFETKKWAHYAVKTHTATNTTCSNYLRFVCGKTRRSLLQTPAMKQGALAWKTVLVRAWCWLQPAQTHTLKNSYTVTVSAYNTAYNSCLS